MSVFNESEWGNSQVFSYYPDTGSSKFVVSSSVLNASLQKVQKKHKNSSKLQSNKKRKIANEAITEESGDQQIQRKKNKRQKCLNEGERLSSGKVSDCPSENRSNCDTVKLQRDALDPAGSSPKKKKKKKDNIKKEAQKEISKQPKSVNFKITGTVNEKTVNTDAHNENGSSKSRPKKVKKKKTVNKRNKYKVLNTEQNKKKRNAQVNGSIEVAQPLKEKGNTQVNGAIEVGLLLKEKGNQAVLPKCELISEHISDKNNNKGKKKKKNKSRKTKVDEITTSAANIPRCVDNTERSEVSDNNRREENETVKVIESTVTISNAVKKKRKKDGRLKVNSSKCLKRTSTSAVLNRNSSSSDKVKNASKLLKCQEKKKGLKKVKKVEKENEKKTGSKVSEESNKVKKWKGKIELSDNKNCSKKSKKKKGVKSKEEELIDSDPEYEEFDGEEGDIQLKNDIEVYMKELNFEKCKQGVAVDYTVSSDDGWETDEDISIEESEDKVADDEYMEDVQTESKGTSEKLKVNKKGDIKKRDENGKVLTSKFIEKNSNKLISEKKAKQQQSTSSPPTNVNKVKKFNKDILNKMLQEADQKDKKNLETSPKVLNTAEALRQKMTDQLTAAKFRLVNEKMYTATSSDALKMFKKEPKEFISYHEGFQSQVARWPMNPLDIIIKWLKNKPREWVVADFGCGEAILAKKAIQKEVHSFDLVAVNKRVTVCDMAHTPLQSKSVNVVVFCLSLMGTNIKDFILEASRVLQEGGIMKIAEVESRFNDVNYFVNHIKKFGFHLTYQDTSKEYFYMFEFVKKRSLQSKGDIPNIVLKPCKYKKR